MADAPDSPPEFRANLRWKADCFGRENQALYAGSLWAGSVNEFTRDEKPCWRAWISSDEDGRCLGWYDTFAAAQSALVAAVMEMQGE